MGLILIVEDDDRLRSALRLALRDEGFEVEAVHDAETGLERLSAIDPDLDLLLVDLEMPGMDGAKILSYATEKGLNKNRIIILSGHDAEYLHRRFPMGRCLAVLNKHEVRQQGVLEMIFRSLHERSLKRAHADREKE